MGYLSQAGGQECILYYEKIADLWRAEKKEQAVVYFWKCKEEELLSEEEIKELKPKSNIIRVYLNDVPYTGLEDINGAVWFVIALIIWSSILAYMFLRNKLAPKQEDFETYIQMTFV